MTPSALLVKASILLAIAAVVQAIFARRASAATRHLIWMLAITGLLLLPILSSLLPGWTVVRVTALSTPEVTLDVESPRSVSPVFAAGRAGSSGLFAAPPAEATRTPPADSGIPWLNALPGLYAAGVLLLLGRLIAERLSTRRLARRATRMSDPEWRRLLVECAERIGVRRPVGLLRSRDQTIPMAFGIWNASIVVPAVADMWSEDRRRAVLLHELAHVARYDCLTQMLAAVACALYWIHPGAWWISRRLRIERELACDDCVLSTGANARDYAGHLLELAYTVSGRRAPALAVCMAGSRQVEGRIVAALDAARNRATPSVRRRVAGAAMMIVTLVPLAAATATLVPADPDRQLTLSIRNTDRTRVRPTVESAQDQGVARRAIERGSAEASSDLTIRAREHGVSPEYIRELRRLGYDFTLEEVIKARDHGVSPQYVRELSELGYVELSLQMLVRARDHGVSPEYIRELGQLGYDFTLEELMKARDHGVSPQYVRELSELGHGGLSLEMLTRARDHGISPEYIQELRERGHQLTLDDLIKARDHGVGAVYINELTAVGYGQVSFDELIRLRDHGVTAQYVKELTRLRYGRLTVDELVRLRDQGMPWDRIRHAIGRMWTMNIRQLAWHVECASAWVQQIAESGGVPRASDSRSACTTR